ncbi:hypothetical protein WM40_19620 [Robbsia andropogonis]|uniref:Uncharacterized protein n=1 Tax=Robbsia andropogonis TaxID=28092 RepID=A0A0F5JWV1_9BURK|nr:hypothetical protein [Robbsia andropogonis]KKB62094.1 hypothetical protein WM40_19620 [Robbsia andropogonis]MCP1117444.1 hypothetical protein [Robbsia andropogonis]MCP1126910.1 hypothetical protein [Robbsia andropogonis]
MSASHRFALTFLLPQQDDDFIPGESPTFDAQLECHISRMDGLSLRELRADPIDWDDADIIDPLLDFPEYREASDIIDMTDTDGSPARSRRYS